MGKQSADIIIIGGGAAGLMAASGAAGKFKIDGKAGRVIVLEKMARPGRKIMITGKGRCNFTNVKPWNEFSGYIHPKPNFLKHSFYNLTSEGMISFLESNGTETIVERGDRAFPASHLASDIVDALVRAAESAGAEIHCSKEVSEISRNEDNFRIICSDGSSYTCNVWARNFGHTIKTLFPSLTAIVPRGYKEDATAGDLKGHISRNTILTETGESLCGNQLKNVNLSLYIDGNPAQEEFGDLDFTDGGIEGPIGFKVSRRCVNAIVNGSKAYVVIDMKPAVELEDLTVRIGCLWNEISKDKRNANKPYKDRFRILLTKVLPMSMIPGFLKLNPAADHKTLAKALKNWKFEIAGFVGYERCVITAGGISLDEITAKTLESKLIPGLHFAGEVLDLDADTGGYNLQTAFSTGYLAGISAAK